VETLCRALAGKNRQLHVQLEEYAKVTKNLRAKEKALRSAEARNLALQVKTREDGDVVREDLVSDSRKRVRETHHDAFASRVSRGWGMDDGLYHDDDDSKRKKELGSSFPTAAAFSEEDVSFGATRKNRSSSFAARTGVGVNASRGTLHGGGPLSRVPRAVKSSKKHTNKTGKSGEDLLDDILGSVDANASREASDRNKTDRNKKPNGFDLASLASRRRGDLNRDGNRDENRMYPAIDLTADDAVGGGGGGSFIIHGADGSGGASGSLDRFLVRE